MRAGSTDLKGESVAIDSLVQGFVGFTDKSASGRVFFVSPYGWVGFFDTDRKKQWISYPGRFLVRGAPRPESKRTDVPERLRR